MANYKYNKKTQEEVGFFEYTQFTILFFTVVVYAFMFMDLIIFNDISFLGTEVVFGKSISEFVILKFNFLVFLAYLIPIVSIVFIFVNLKKYNQIKYIIIGLLFITSAILLILLPKYISNSFGNLTYDGVSEDVLNDALIRIAVDPIFTAIKNYEGHITAFVVISSICLVMNGALSILLSTKANIK